jgi:peptide-methionine (S)-S-oxide reductase
MNQKVIFFFLALSYFHNSCSQHNEGNEQTYNRISMDKKFETATFGAGCYWCVEAIFQRLNGVTSVKSGFSGGHIKNPSYKEVCNGTTGHAEVCQIYFDTSVISYTELLEVFWKTHDPTTLNRQGNDIGTQYRSAIFYHNDKQKELAEEMKLKLDQAKIWNDPIVTEIVPFDAFYQAEDYHQDYYDNNVSQPYCTYVITPKIEKFEKVFRDKIRN